MARTWQTGTRRKTGKALAEEQFTRGLENLVVPARITAEAGKEKQRISEAGQTQREQLDIAARASGRSAVTASNLATAKKTGVETAGLELEQAGSEAAFPGQVSNVLAQQKLTAATTADNVTAQGLRRSELKRAVGTEKALFQQPTGLGGVTGVPEVSQAPALAKPGSTGVPRATSFSDPGPQGVNFLENILKRKTKSIDEILAGGII